MHHPRWNRRHVLHVGGLTGLGLSLPDWALGRCAAAGAVVAEGPVVRPAQHCILIWLDGGPSHLETWDLKPAAPAEVRGPLSAIATSVAGIRISECLPLVAQQMQSIALIRSLTSPLGEHNLGTHYLLTGYQPTPVLEYPAFAAVACAEWSAGGSMPRQPAPQAAASRLSGSVLPPHMAVPNFSVGGADFSGNGFLPRQFAPFSVGADPAAANFQVRDLELWPGLDLPRVARRREFAERLARLQERSPQQDNAGGLNADTERAFQLVSSTEARAAFQLEQETPAVRQRYGLRTPGQSCLLARRLIERGVPLVTVNFRGWDTHANLVTQLKDGYTGAQQPVGLLPQLDQALSALLQDLRDRGLLDETLVIVMGEFGRTPKINAAGGRDHWPRVFSAALAGGGVRGGQVVGASDRHGESPLERPVTPADLIRTVYVLLGLDPDAELQTADGRTVRISPSAARVVQELVS